MVIKHLLQPWLLGSLFVTQVIMTVIWTKGLSAVWMPSKWPAYSHTYEVCTTVEKRWDPFFFFHIIIIIKWPLSVEYLSDVSLFKTYLTGASQHSTFTREGKLWTDAQGHTLDEDSQNLNPGWTTPVPSSQNRLAHCLGPCTPGDAALPELDTRLSTQATIRAWAAPPGEGLAHENKPSEWTAILFIFLIRLSSVSGQVPKVFPQLVIHAGPGMYQGQKQLIRRVKVNCLSSLLLTWHLCRLSHFWVSARVASFTWSTPPCHPGFAGAFSSSCCSISSRRSSTRLCEMGRYLPAWHSVCFPKLTAQLVMTPLTRFYLPH